MTTSMTTTNGTRTSMTTTNGTSSSGAVLERVISLGDLQDLKPIERTHYYVKVCESLGLNPLTQPFAYIKLNGKLTLYAKRDTTDQLRKIHKVSVTIVSRERIDELVIITARATTPDGRTDESTGAVSLSGLKGENLANALMKAETKAKRRVTLSICGLGWLDETEVSDVKGAKPVTVTQDGEVVEGDLTRALVQSINWEEWAAKHRETFAKASTKGELGEAWLAANDDVKRLNPPEPVVAALIDAKDARKRELS